MLPKALSEALPLLSSFGIIGSGKEKILDRGPRKFLATVPSAASALKHCLASLTASDRGPGVGTSTTIAIAASHYPKARLWPV